MKNIYQNWIRPFLLPIVIVVVTILSAIFLPIVSASKAPIIGSAVFLLFWRIIHKKLIQKRWSNWLTLLPVVALVFTLLGPKGFLKIKTPANLVQKKEVVKTEEVKNVVSNANIDTTNISWTSGPGGMILNRTSIKGSQKTLYFDDTTIIVSNEDNVFADLKTGDIVFVSNNNGKMIAKLLGENKTYFCGPSEAICGVKKGLAQENQNNKSDTRSRQAKSQRVSIADYTKGMPLEKWSTLPESQKLKYREVSQKIAEKNKAKGEPKSLR